MAAFSRGPREHWLKPHFSENEVANSGCIKTLIAGASLKKENLAA
jgi:hypothetical protein